jgi:DNA-binding LacI/PurR family transcriptional regulator
MKHQKIKNNYTLKDIAREADLSPSTVLLVLQNPKTTRVRIF